MNQGANQAIVAIVDVSLVDETSLRSRSQPGSKSAEAHSLQEPNEHNIHKMSKCARRWWDKEPLRAGDPQMPTKRVDVP